MTTLVIGASGATGRLLVEQLFKRRQNVRVCQHRYNTVPETPTEKCTTQTTREVA